MNREIKFRGIRIDDNQWIYGYLVIDPKGKSRIHFKPFDEAKSNTYYFVYPESVGQFTGLKDKNGKEIYEGDIVSIDRNEGTFIAETKWNNQGACFYFLNGKYYRDIMSCAQSGDGESTYLDKLEIIGNIHENPELLK